VWTTFQVIAAKQVPEHATSRGFRQAPRGRDHQPLSSVLVLCAQAGIVELGVIAIDRRKVHANASQHATRDYDRIARQILGEANAVREEDERHSHKRGR
jgi:hypothetical protein